MAACLEVPEPRLGAHADQDHCAEWETPDRRCEIGRAYITTSTWSSWDFTSACGHTSTSSAPAIAGQFSSDPLWNLCSSPGTSSSPPMPQPGGSSTSLRSSSPWTTRRMPSGVRPSLTSDWSAQHPAQFERASKSSSASESMAVIRPPQSVTTLPLRVSARSAPPPSSPSLGRSASKWAQPYLDFPQKMSGHTLSALVEPWPCTARTSLTGPVWPLGGCAC